MSNQNYYGVSNELTPAELNHILRMYHRCTRKRELGICSLSEFNPFQCQNCDCCTALKMLQNLDDLTKSRMEEKEHSLNVIEKRREHLMKTNNAIYIGYMIFLAIGVIGMICLFAL